MRLAALARGGDGGSTLLSGKEMRSYRDWELLKDKQAIENEGRYLNYGVGIITLFGHKLLPADEASPSEKLRHNTARIPLIWVLVTPQGRVVVEGFFVLNIHIFLSFFQILACYICMLP